MRTERPKTRISIRNICALLILTVSLFMLYPGLVEPVFTIQASTKTAMLGEVELYKSTQSIMQTIENLFRAENHVVAFLILLFGVIVPLIKITLLLSILVVSNRGYRSFISRFVNMIGKWSMADVFAVSILMGLLTTKSNSFLNAELHQGFYYFTAYCLLSILGAQLIEPGKTLLYRSQ